MRVAVVDVGSNTARVRLADVVGGRVDVVAERRARLGLGEEIARTGTLSRDTVAIVARLCRDYADRARALEAGCSDFIAKPYDLAELRAAIDSARCSGPMLRPSAAMNSGAMPMKLKMLRK